MCKRSVFVVLVLLVVISSFVLSDDAGAIDEKFVEGFIGGGSIPSESINLANENKDLFIKLYSEKIGISSLGEIGGKIKEFDLEGNLVLSNGNKIPLKQVNDYISKINSGDSGSYEYEVQGEKYGANNLQIKSIKVDGDELIYEFHNGGSVSLTEGATYDLSTRKITDKGGKEYEWLGMKGKIEAGEKLEFSPIYVDGGDDNLRNFPLLRTGDGDYISPFHKIVTDVKVPSNIVPSEIKSGNYRTFEANGKRYSVNSEGLVREISESSVSLGSDVLTGSSIFVSREGYGEVFLGENMEVHFGGSLPTTDKNYIYIGDLSGDKRDISIRSREGETYYEVTSEVGKLHLEGNVFVKNGDVIIRSTADGKILFMELTENAKFEHGIEELLNPLNPDKKYSVKGGQKVSDITGAVVIDLSRVERGGSGSANSRSILSSSAFNELAGNLDAGNKESLALVVVRNLNRLGIASSEENIRILTSEILKARTAFGDRVLFGNELEKLIFIGYSDVFSRHGMREMFANSGIDQSKITIGVNGANDKQTVLDQLKTSTGPTTFLFNGHGYAQGMALGDGRGRISYKEIADALETRYRAGHSLLDVNIMSFACYQYDNLHINLANELKSRGIPEYPMMISQANRGVQSTTDWHYTVQALDNKPAGQSVKGVNFWGAERGKGDDPALSIPVKLKLGGGEELILLEIS